MTYEFKAGQEGLRTRDGREAEIYRVRDGGESFIHGAMLNKDTGAWSCVAWHLGGRYWGFGGESPSDLMPPRREVWVAVWRIGDLPTVYVDTFDTHEAAVSFADYSKRTRLAVLGPVDREPAP